MRACSGSRRQIRREIADAVLRGRWAADKRRSWVVGGWSWGQHIVIFGARVGRRRADGGHGDVNRSQVQELVRQSDAAAVDAGESVEADWWQTGRGPGQALARISSQPCMSANLRLFAASAAHPTDVIASQPSVLRCQPCRSQECVCWPPVWLSRRAGLKARRSRSVLKGVTPSQVQQRKSLLSTVVQPISPPCGTPLALHTNRYPPNT